MELIVKGASTYCYTGGRPHQSGQPTVVFLHGVLNDHSCWILQSRFLAHHGFNVMAVDLPGHARSQGEPPASVEDAAEFVHALLDAAQVPQAALVGHSWGSLIALEAAARLGERITHAALIGTAFPMRVSPALLEAAQTAPQRAIALINQFSRSTLAPPPSALGPGTWVHGASTALNRRVLASNAHVNLLHCGFLACDRYAGGLDALARVRARLLFVLGELDQMTPPKAARSLIERAQALGLPVAQVSLPVGHHQMSEAPDATLQALRHFLR